MKPKPLDLIMTIRVALVEDDERVRGSLAMLVGGSLRLELIGSYIDAESAIENLPKTEPNVVLMDVRLPKQSGIECVRKLKPHLPAPRSLSSRFTRMRSACSTLCARAPWAF